MFDIAPWQVRIHHVDGQVLGAGILVGDRRMLTCAHGLLLGFRHPAVLRRRLDELAAPVSDALDRSEALERYRQQVAGRIAGSPELPHDVPQLRIRLTALRRAASSADATSTDPSGSWLVTELDKAEAAAYRKAHGALRQRPCDLVAAKRLVERYLGAAQHKIDTSAPGIPR